MKFDLYTKFVLTVIAVCLVWVCLRDVALVRSAQAAPPQCGGCTQDVRITGIKLGSQSGFDEKYLPVKVVEK